MDGVESHFVNKIPCCISACEIVIIQHIKPIYSSQNINFQNLYVKKKRLYQINILTINTFCETVNNVYLD